MFITGDQDESPDCILEDLERPGVLPPSPSPSSSPMARSSSLTSQLVSQCVTRTSSCMADDEAHIRLPGTFDSLQQVQDSGLTPSPRPETPLVLLPLQDSARESLQESLKRRLKSSLRLSGK